MHWRSSILDDCVTKASWRARVLSNSYFHRLLLLPQPSPSPKKTSLLPSVAVPASPLSSLWTTSSLSSPNPPRYLFPTPRYNISVSSSPSSPQRTPPPYRTPSPPPPLSSSSVPVVPPLLLLLSTTLQCLLRSHPSSLALSSPSPPVLFVAPTKAVACDWCEPRNLDSPLSALKTVPGVTSSPLRVAVVSSPSPLRSSSVGCSTCSRVVSRSRLRRTLDRVPSTGRVFSACIRSSGLFSEAGLDRPFLQKQKKRRQHQQQTRRGRLSLSLFPRCQKNPVLMTKEERAKVLKKKTAVFFFFFDPSSCQGDLNLMKAYRKKGKN